MRKKARNLVGGLAALAVLLAVPATASAGTLLGSGSSALQPYLEPLVKGYQKVDPTFKVVYNPNNGNAGAKDVQAGRSAFALQTRPPLPSDSGLTYSKLFLDALCITVNPSNPLTGLKVADVKDIYTAKVTEWSQVPGAPLTTPIAAFGRPTTAGLYTFFQSAVLGGESPASNVTVVDKDGEVAVAVSKNKEAIGYVGLANSAPGHGVKRLKLDGQPCEASAIKTLKYPLVRYAWIVLPSKKPSKSATKFADWIRTSYEAGQIIAKAGAVPAFNPTKKPKKKKRKH